MCAAALDSPLYKEAKWLLWENLIDSLLRVPWEPFASPNDKRTAVLQTSGTNSCCSAPGTVCMSVVPSVLCALSTGEFDVGGKALKGLSLRAGQGLAVMLAGIGLCVCELWVIAVEGRQREEEEWRT